MRLTLLEMTQQILSAMDGDEVNTISDTVESYQVALLIRQVFYDIATELQLPEHENLFQLTPSNDSELPCLMSLPTNVVRLDNIQYDNKLSTDTHANWQPVEFMPFDEFIQYQNSLKEWPTTDVKEMLVPSNGDTFKFLCRKDVFPTYYTTFNDTTLVFNGYKSTEDSTLQNSKTLCAGSVYPTFTLSDSFTATLDPSQFSYFFNKAKTRAFFEIKQQENPESARETRDQKIRLQKAKRRTPDETELEKTQRYGRK